MNESVDSKAARILGNTLRAIRLEKKLALAEVAESLQLPESLLRALENGETENEDLSLHHRGAIRYMLFLGIINSNSDLRFHPDGLKERDEDSEIDSPVHSIDIDQPSGSIEASAEKQPSEQYAESDLVSSDKRFENVKDSRVVTYLRYGRRITLVGMVCFLAYYFWPSNVQEQQSPPVVASPTFEQVNDRKEGNLATPVEEITVTGQSELSDESSDFASSPLRNPAIGSEDVLITSSQPAESGDNGRAVSQTAVSENGIDAELRQIYNRQWRVVSDVVMPLRKEVRIQSKGFSWVEVMDGKGTLVMYGMMQPNGLLSASINPPVEVLISNTSVVNLTLNGNIYRFDKQGVSDSSWFVLE